MSEYASMIRKEWAANDAKRDAGLTIPEEIQRFDNLTYGIVDQKWQKLDVYRLKYKTGKLPVILSIHGGGWVYGDKDLYQYYCMSLAQKGFAVVNYSYRLAPEYQYPSSFEDTTMVADWIMDHAEKYGFDTEHIFGVGDSAGAHMLSLYAAALTNSQYFVPYPLAKGFSFCAIALNCGIYHLQPETMGETMQLMKDFLPKGGTSEELHDISPINYVNEKFPPCFIMTCPGDFLNAAPEELVAVLKKNSVPFVYRTYGNQKNPLTHDFHCNMRLAEAKLCNEEECRFFQEFC